MNKYKRRRSICTVYTHGYLPLSINEQKFIPTQSVLALVANRTRRRSICTVYTHGYLPLSINEQNKEGEEKLREFTTK